MKFKRKFATILLLGSLLVAGSVAGQLSDQASAQESGTGEVSVLGLGNPNAIAGEYIVVMKDGVTTTALNSSIRSVTPIGTLAAGAEPFVQFKTAFSGFAGELSPEALAELKADPNVAFIEANSQIRLDYTWGQDRIDQRGTADGSPYSPLGTGRGVHAYVIDSGMRVTQRQFAGRVGNGFSAFDAEAVGDVDCQGHGTHVAGTVGGSEDGIAPDVMLHSVKVFECNDFGLPTATTEQVIAGIDWVAANHAAPAVANLSLGGGASAALDTAVDGLIDVGVTVVVSAGNNNQDACGQSPARVPRAITVGATTRLDTRASFSNTGRCLDLFAPGEEVVSANFSSDSARSAKSGTSMAAPHVAGAAAIWLENNPGSTPAMVAAGITTTARRDILRDVGEGSPNLFLFVERDGPPEPFPSGGCSFGNAEHGRLDGLGDSDTLVNGTWFFAPGVRDQQACLVVSNGAEFELTLEMWTGTRWTVVLTAPEGAINSSGANVKFVTYDDGESGYYRWRVAAERPATGAYEFDLALFEGSRYVPIGT